MGYKNKPKKDAYEVVTNQIIEQLEKGEVAWHKSWKGCAGLPKNLVSKKPYRGINLFMLSLAPYSSPYYLTYNQAKKLGGYVKKGEKGLPIVFWKIIEREDKDGEKDNYAFIRYSTVFNIEQCEGIEAPEGEETNKQIDFSPIEHCEAIVKGYIGKPEVRHDQQRAFYSPTEDYVNMPEADTFESNEDYYSVLFHEFGHSTGHKSRLNRDEVNDFHFFGDSVYSKEELTAEFASAFLCAETGISNEKLINNSSAYIQGWLKKLRNDKKFLVSASSKAQRAVDWIMGRRKDSALKDEREKEKATA